MTKLTLEFGYNPGLPDTVTAAWGARGILHKNGDLDIPPDRRSVAGDKEKVKRICAALDRFGMKRLLKAVKTAVENGFLRSNVDEPYILYEDQEIVVVGNTRASYGHLHLAAYLKVETLPAGNITYRTSSLKRGIHDAFLDGKYVGRVFPADDRWEGVYLTTQVLPAIVVADSKEEATRKMIAAADNRHMKDLKEVAI